MTLPRPTVNKGAMPSPSHDDSILSGDVIIIICVVAVAAAAVVVGSSSSSTAGVGGGTIEEAGMGVTSEEAADAVAAGDC
jgi:hypothetical protein